MRESRPYGSVRGALSNERPYRDFSFPWLGFFFPKAWIFLPPAWIFLPRFAQKENFSGPAELNEQ